MFVMSTDAKWSVGTGLALLVAILAVFTMLSARLNSMEARIDSRLLSIEEHLRAAPAPAAPEPP